MATEIKLRRGTTAEHSSFNGAEGEVTFDTDLHTLIVHNNAGDGTGERLAKYTEVQASNELSEMLDVNLTSPADGSVLKYDNASSKWIDSSNLTETATGINVTGTINTDGIWLENNQKINLGAESGGKLEIYEATNGNGVIEQTDGGDLWIRGENITLRNDDAETLISTGHTNALMYWQGDTGTKGERLRTTDSGIDVTGTVDCDGLSLGDGEYAQFGTSNDLQIFHSGNHSYIKDQGTGILSIQSNGDSITFHDSANARNMAKFSVGGTASLDWAGGTGTGTKLATTATGIDVTGTVTADGLTLGAGEIATFNSGAGGDLQISGDATGSFSLIKQTGGGDLIIQGQNGHLRNDANGSLIAWDADNVNLSWQGTTGAGTKLSTTETGIDVTGTVTADGLSLGDNEKITLGTLSARTNSDGESLGDHYDLEIFHETDGTTKIVEYGGKNLAIEGESVAIRDNSGNRKFYANSGANGAAFMYYGEDAEHKFRTYGSGTVTIGNHQIESDGANGSDPDLILRNKEAAADGNITGQLLFQGKQETSDDYTSYSYIATKAVDVTDATKEGEMNFHVRDGASASPVERLSITKDGIDVTGTVEADAFSGTSDTAITDFITDVSTNNNDTTVPTTAAVKSYVDNNDGDTTYTGGTGLTLDGTTFNVDAAQTQITSVGTLTSLTTGDTTINGNLEVKSTTADGNFLPEIRLKRDGGVDAGDDGDVLGALVFEGDNFDGTQKDYARIGVSIKDDGTGVSDGAVRGEIRFATAFGGSSAGATLEDPAFRIDDHGVHLNETSIDGSANFYNIPRASLSGLKYWENNGAGFATEVKCQTPTQDNDINFPDSSGNVVVATIAGGGINGGGGIGSARTTWSKTQMIASPNSTYVHYNAANTNDLVVSPPHIGIDVNNAYYGTTWKFTNNSTTSSKIILDLDGYGNPALQYYTIMKYDGSASGQSATILSTGSNLTVSGGGQITLTAVDNSVMLVEGIGYS